MNNKKSLITSTSVTMPSKKDAPLKKSHVSEMDYSQEVDVKSEAASTSSYDTVVKLHKKMDNWLQEMEKGVAVYDTEVKQLFKIMVVDMNGTPVPNARVGVWEACLKPSNECMLINELTDEDGYVQFYHSYPEHIDLKVRCRHPSMPNMNGMDTVVSSNQTPIVITLDFEIMPRHLPNYRSPYV